MEATLQVVAVTALAVVRLLAALYVPATVLLPAKGSLSILQAVMPGLVKIIASEVVVEHVALLPSSTYMCKILS